MEESLKEELLKEKLLEKELSEPCITFINNFYKINYKYILTYGHSYHETLIHEDILKAELYKINKLQPQYQQYIFDSLYQYLKTEYKDDMREYSYILDFIRTLNICDSFSKIEKILDDIFAIDIDDEINKIKIHKTKIDLKRMEFSVFYSIFEGIKTSITINLN